MKPNSKSTVNVTLKLHNHNLIEFENWLKDKFDLIDFKVVADTSKMYENDKHFQKIIKNIKELNNLKLDYINRNNYKYV